MPGCEAKSSETSGGSWGRRHEACTAVMAFRLASTWLASNCDVGCARPDASRSEVPAMLNRPPSGGYSLGVDDDELWQRIMYCISRRDSLNDLAGSLGVDNAHIWHLVKVRLSIRPEDHLVVPKETLDALLSQIDRLSTENAELR